MVVRSTSGPAIRTHGDVVETELTTRRTTMRTAAAPRMTRWVAESVAHMRRTDSTARLRDSMTTPFPLSRFFPRETGSTPLIRHYPVVATRLRQGFGGYAARRVPLLCAGR